MQETASKEKHARDNMPRDSIYGTATHAKATLKTVQKDTVSYKGHVRRNLRVRSCERRRQGQYSKTQQQGAVDEL